MKTDNNLDLPWQMGKHTEHGVFNPEIIQTKEGKAICVVYDIPMHSTLEEVKTAGSRYKGLAKAEYIVEACNSHATLTTQRDALRDSLIAMMDGLRAQNDEVFKKALDSWQWRKANDALALCDAAKEK